MNLELAQIRIKAFLWEFVSLTGTTLLAMLSSDEFRALIMQHSGETATAGVLLLVVTGAVKHLRNLTVIKDRERQFGSALPKDSDLI